MTRESSLEMKVIFKTEITLHPEDPPMNVTDQIRAELHMAVDAEVDDINHRKLHPDCL